MGRNKKTEIAKAEDGVVVDVQNPEQTSQPSETKEVEKAPESTDKKSNTGKSTEEISPREAELMRLNPQYEKIWITPKGFVHPEGTPEYLLKGAKLFKNKFFNNKK